MYIAAETQDQAFELGDAILELAVNAPSRSVSRPLLARARSAGQI